ncbi:IolE/MocC family protein [Paenibacillus albus]|uniref:Uncharacterized protein n=1 Tax=Paenibacillus albus TaxID=2495582 RepID=A0A3S9AA30_9BACL|nr:hypothetical protein [Paenibacillus albus]AZN42629.1 hypothetical protein EJC50_25265 [Paenibacillus albus]
MSRKIVFILLLISFSLTVSCTRKPSIDIGDAVGKTEDSFRKLDGIATTASSYDGKKDIKFRLMVKGNLTEAEATKLFRRIMDTIAEFSNRPDVWDFYNGYFDIKSYDYGVIYDGIKLIGEDVKVQPK